MKIFEHLNSFVDYKGLYSFIRRNHLKLYPTIDDYLGNYLCGDYDALKLKDAEDLYCFLLNPEHDQIITDCVVDLESSSFSLSYLIGEIYFEYDNMVYSFTIDFIKECFSEYSNY